MAACLWTYLEEVMLDSETLNGIVHQKHRQTTIQITAVEHGDCETDNGNRSVRYISQSE